MRMVPAADDLDAEVERLVALGAALSGRAEAGVEMADPDGNEFRLRSTSR